jgi:hypothetical protein
MEKNKKKFTIFNPIICLNSLNKPKIQHVDQETIKEFCNIAMEFMMDNETTINEEVREEYERYAKDRSQLASFDLFPGVRDFINEAMNA